MRRKKNIEGMVTKHAKYKIEVGMSPKKNWYKGTGNSPGYLMVFKSGSALDGGGDELVFFCPTCKGLVDPEHTNGGIYACAKCGGQGPVESLSENKMINGSLDFYAKLFHRHWLQCGMDADLYLKKFKSEGRHAKDVLKDDFAEGVKILKEHRQNRELVIYPLVNMLKDDIGGSDMLKRIETFLRA